MEGSSIDPQIKSAKIEYRDQVFKINDIPNKSFHFRTMLDFEYFVCLMEYLQTTRQTDLLCFHS